ncbi:hypothetical protein K1T71_003559 [Dendrolimus kikuchii]|uniref:Uncharacterized protein n=1 Tax=Dendrolimus kikuchii TaxID=765133 RepID=A0ACC1DBY0_9NEOP|nr:hypothetical protein K1T71_003559 [Dendrolimus kikuchii]
MFNYKNSLLCTVIFYGSGGSTVYNEIPCTAQGGTCVADNQCPSGKVINVKGLCPVQQPNGVECCTRAPKARIVRNPTSCRSRGGECTLGQCAEFISMATTDCDSGQKCCIYV